jgi:probable F420-dependent oxidoreductase
MELGFGVPVAGAWATPANQVRVARRAEELGYRSLWTFQRLVVPEVPDERSGAPFYQQVQDAVVPLAFLAGQTSRIRLGTAVLIVPFFSPALLAKQLATLDIVSGGRLDVGLGIGWSRTEYTAVGASFERRGARAEEFLAALRALWTGEVASYQGEFYRLPPARMAPGPVQRPHPPLLLGGTARPALRRAGRLADGWVSGSTADLTRIGESIEVVRAAAREAGRDPERLRFVCRGAVKVRPAGQPDRAPLSGSLAEIRSDFDMLAAQGVTEVFVDLNFDPEIGAPDTDPAGALRRAEEALEALAPS